MLDLYSFYFLIQGKKWISNPQTQNGSLHKSSPFDRLTDDVVLRIFSFLQSTQLALCGRVSRRWHVLAWEPQLWSTIVLSGDHLSADRALKVITF
jgi:F-box/leucine-rich repeat protein 7